MTKKVKGRRKRSMSEKVWIVISIVIALAMVGSVILPFLIGSGGPAPGF